MLVLHIEYKLIINQSGDGGVTVSILMKYLFGQVFRF